MPLTATRARRAPRSGGAVPSVSFSSGTLQAARFISRPNRFIVHAELADGRRVAAHLPDPGRLKELLLKGAELRLRPASPGLKRKTAHTVVLVRALDPPRPWVSIDTTLANRLARALLEHGGVRGVGRGWEIRPEVRHGSSRFDFLLSRGNGDSVLVEVKSATLVENGVALFPDAPTVRGTRHLRELAALARDGRRTLVLFVAQRHDPREVRPNPRTDPDFTAALAAAHGAGVMVRAARFRLSARGTATYEGSLPVRLK